MAEDFEAFRGTEVPWCHVDNLAVLIVNRTHPRFGQIARLEMCDWRESGNLYVKYSDDASEAISIGGDPGQPPSPAKLFYRLRNETGSEFDNRGVGPVGLLNDYASLGIGDSKTFLEHYQDVFRETF